MKLTATQSAAQLHASFTSKPSSSPAQAPALNGLSHAATRFPQHSPTSKGLCASRDRCVATSAHSTDSSSSSSTPTWTSRMSRVLWQLAPGVALLLQQASSSQPSVAAYLTAEFVSMTDSWKTSRIAQLPPARRQGLEGLADGWQIAQERYHLYHTSAHVAGETVGGAASSSPSSVPVSGDALLRWVLPDPVSLIAAPVLLRGGAGSLSTWLSAPQGAAADVSEAELQLDKQHSFLMHQVLELIMSPGQERLVQPFPPTPRPRWLCLIAERVVAASQALQQPPQASTFISGATMQPGSLVAGLVSSGQQHEAASAALDKLLSEQAVAAMGACVYMPIKDALGRDLGPGLLCASWLYQVITATIVLYCSNASHSTPDKLIICQAVAADLADGVRILQQARVPLADHMLLYLAVQQLGLLTDLHLLGMDQTDVMAQVARQVSELAEHISTTQPGLVIVFDAYHRLGEYHLQVTHQHDQAVHALRRALVAFRTRTAFTWDGLQEWSDDLSGCSLYSTWRYMCDEQLQAAHPGITLTHLPEALFLHRDHLRCITNLLVAEQKLQAAQSDAPAASPAQQAARDAQAPLQALSQLLAAATQELIPRSQSSPPSSAIAPTPQLNDADPQAEAAADTPPPNESTTGSRLASSTDSRLAREYLASTHAIAILMHQHEQATPPADQQTSKQQTKQHRSKQSWGRPPNGSSQSAGSSASATAQDPVQALTNTGRALWNDLTAPEPGLGLMSLAKDLPTVFARTVQQETDLFTTRMDQQAHFISSWLKAHPDVCAPEHVPAQHLELWMQIQPYCKEVLLLWGGRPPGLTTQHGSIWQQVLAFSSSVVSACASSSTPLTQMNDASVAVATGVVHALVPLVTTPVHALAKQVMSCELSVPEEGVFGTAAAPVIRHALSAGHTQEAVQAVRALASLPVPRASAQQGQATQLMSHRLFSQLVSISHHVMQCQEHSLATSFLQLIQGWTALDDMQLASGKASHAGGSGQEERPIKFRLFDEMCGAAVQHGATSWLLSGALESLLQDCRYDAGNLSGQHPDQAASKALSPSKGAGKAPKHGAGHALSASLPNRLVQAVAGGIDQAGSTAVLLQLIKAVLRSSASSKAPAANKGMKAASGMLSHEQDSQAFVVFVMMVVLGADQHVGAAGLQATALGIQVTQAAAEAGALPSEAVAVLLTHALTAAAGPTGSKEPLQLVTRDVLSSLPHDTLCAVLDHVLIEEPQAGAASNALLLCEWLSQQVNPKLCRAYQPSTAAMQQLLLRSLNTAADAANSKAAVGLAAGLQSWVQATTPRVLAALLGVAVEMARACQPNPGQAGTAALSPTSAQLRAYSHHLTAAMVIFQELNVQWAESQRSARHVQHTTTSRVFPTPIELADVCAQLLQLLSTTGQTSALVLPHSFREGTLKAAVDPTRGARGKHKQGGKEEGVRAVKGRLLTMAFEQSMAMCSEQLTAAVQPGTLLATCQAYLGQGSIQQAVGVALSASKPNSAIIMAYLLTSRKFTHAQTLAVGVLVALVQQACELRSPELLEQAVHLVMDRQQTKPLLQCLRRQTFAGMLLLLLRQPPTPTCIQLIRAWLNHRANLAPAALVPPPNATDAWMASIDTTGLQLSGTVWASIARAALHHARPGAPRNTVGLVVQLVLLCTPQMSGNQATALCMAAAGAALECGACTDLAAQALSRVSLPTSLVAAQPTSGAVDAASASQGWLLESGLTLLNRCGGLRSAQLGEARDRVVKVAEWVMQRLDKQPLYIQQQLSEAAHRSVILLLCQHSPDAAITALRLWGYIRPGLRLSRDAREQVLIASVQASQWDVACQLCADLLGPEWQNELLRPDGSGIGSKWQALPLTLKCAGLAALAASQGRVEQVLGVLHHLSGVDSRHEPDDGQANRPPRDVLPIWLLNGILQGMMTSHQSLPKHTQYTTLAWLLSSCAPGRAAPANAWSSMCVWPEARGLPLLQPPGWLRPFPALAPSTVNLARALLKNLGFSSDECEALLQGKSGLKQTWHRPG